jgi:hypothetical protein
MASGQKLAAFSKPDGSPNYQAAFNSDFYDDLIAGVARMQSVGTILPHRWLPAAVFTSGVTTAAFTRRCEASTLFPVTTRSRLIIAMVELK